MENASSKILSFIIKSTDNDIFSSKSFGTKPSPEREKTFGKIFGFILIESPDEKIKNFIDYIVEEIKIHYSESQKTEMDAFGSFNIERSFETTLQKTNLSIARYLQIERISLDLNKIHALVGVLRERSLFFTALGSINAYLLHYKLRNEYAMVNIYEEEYSRENEINPLKLFTQTISGKVEKQDYCFFCTSNVMDYFSLEKIKNIVTQNNSQDVQRQCKTVLSSIALPKHFLISLIMPAALTQPKKILPESVPIQDYARAAERDSMRRLDHAQRATQKLLNPSVSMHIAKFNKSFRKIWPSLIAQARFILHSRKQKMFQRKDENKKIEQPVIEEPRRPNRGIIFFQNIASSKILKSFFTILNKILYPILMALKNILKKFFALSMRSKFIVIGITVLSVFLFYNIIVKSIINQQTESLAFFEKTIGEVEDMKRNAEEILIYKDEETARVKLLDAKNKLLKIEPKYQKDERYQLLKTAVEQKLSELQHSLSVNEPTQIGNWKNLDKDAVIAPILAFNNSVVYSQNTNNKFIYKLNVETRIPSSVFSPLKNVGNFQLGATWGNEIYFVNDRQTLYVYNMTDDSLTPMPIALKYGSSFNSIKIFNNKVYILDADNNQILKFTKRLNGFIDPEEWVRDPLGDIKTGIAMAIAGDIYVLEKSGNIIKISLGKLNEFKLKTIDPALSGPTKIQTRDTMKYIYILDSGNKRVVAVDKDGYIYQQYSSPLFDDLKDFVVLEKEKKIYVLNGSIIYGIAM